MDVPGTKIKEEEFWKTIINQAKRTPTIPPKKEVTIPNKKNTWLISFFSPPRDLRILKSRLFSTIIIVREPTRLNIATNATREKIRYTAKFSVFSILYNAGFKSCFVNTSVFSPSSSMIKVLTSLSVRELFEKISTDVKAFSWAPVKLAIEASEVNAYFFSISLLIW